MSGYDVIDAMRALPPRAPGRKVRLLVAVATFPAESDGWRNIRLPLLAWRAGMSVKRAQQTRRELESDGLIKFDPPHGSVYHGRYLLTVPQVERNSAPPKDSQVERKSFPGGASLDPRWSVRRSTMSSGLDEKVSGLPCARCGRHGHVREDCTA